MYPLLPIERSTDLRMAMHLAKAYLKSHNINFKLTPYGEHPKSYICTLSSRGVLISMGAGKGAHDLQSKVSSIFEAIEHSALHHDYFKDRMILKKPSAIAKPHWYEDLPFSLLLDNQSTIMCLPYNEVEYQDEIHLPVALVNPSYIEAEEGYPERRCFTPEHRQGDTFDYSYLLKYSTTNGISAGTSADECIIHSVSEIIERYTLAEFIIYFVALNNHEHYKRIQPSSLPDDLSALYACCSKELHGSELYLIDITSKRWKLPTYLVYLDHPEPSFTTFSSGASLNNNYAIERALTEMMQRRAHPHSIFSSNDEAMIKAKLAQWYEKEYGSMMNDEIMCEFNITTIGHRIPEIGCYNFAPNSVPDRTLHEYRQRLVRTVKMAGGEIYYAPLINENHIKVYTCFIYPFEPAFILSSGRIVSLTRANLDSIKNISL